MEYVLIAAIALFVVMAVITPDRFTHIREAYGLVHGRDKDNHGVVASPQQTRPLRPHCKTCRCGTPWHAAGHLAKQMKEMRPEL